jgi:hypothetical protein
MIAAFLIPFLFVSPLLPLFFQRKREMGRKGCEQAQKKKNPTELMERVLYRTSFFFLIVTPKNERESSELKRRVGMELQQKGVR